MALGLDADVVQLKICTQVALTGAGLGGLNFGQFSMNHPNFVYDSLQTFTAEVFSMIMRAFDTNLPSFLTLLAEATSVLPQTPLQILYLIRLWPQWLLSHRDSDSELFQSLTIELALQESQSATIIVQIKGDHFGSVSVHITLNLENQLVASTIVVFSLGLF